MIAKPTRYFWIILLTLLTACGNSVQTNATDIQNTAVAMARTGVVLTLTALPTATLPPPTFTPTALPTSVPGATSIPTEPPPPLITPDAIQVERWKEYQTELAKVLFSFDPEHAEGYDPEEYKDALCEWDILGQSGQEVYVWASCTSADGLGSKSNPAVIYLEPDGSIRKVNVARAEADRRTQFAVYDLHLFPISLQEKLCLYYFFGTVPQCDSIFPNYHPRIGLSSRERVLISHLWSRTSHAEEPPLVVLSVMPTSLPPATPISTEPSPPIITPDAIQVERWREYQTELAKALFSFTQKFPDRPRRHDPDEYKNAVCEWDILGRFKQEVYVWAVCGPGGIGDFNPAVIHLEADGSIQNVKVFGAVGQPHDLPIYDLDPFPVDVQEKLCLYYLGFTANTQCDDSTGTQIDRLYVLLSHLKYREGYAEEPPLIVLSATPTP